MEAPTRDLIFGTGRGADGLRGVFAPRGDGGVVTASDLGATYRGPGSAKVLDWAEQRGFVTAEQRAGHGVAAATGVDELVDVAAGGATTRGLVGAGAAATAAAGTQQYANPIYGGLMAQSLMREHGFVAPTTPPDDVLVGAGVADDVRLVAATAEPVTAAPITAAADDVAARVADLEQRMLAGLQRLGELPQDAKLPVLTRAVDATAQYGGDSYDVLARTMLERPLDGSVVAFERSLDDAATAAAPAAAKIAAPVTPTVAKAVPQVVAAAVPKVVEAATPSIVMVVKPGLATAGTDGALRGVMSFSAGVDDTLRMLARF